MEQRKHILLQIISWHYFVENEATLMMATPVPATVVSVGELWQARSVSAIIVRTSRKRKSPSSGNPNPKAKRRRKLGLDSSDIASFWNQATKLWTTWSGEASIDRVLHRCDCVS